MELQSDRPGGAGSARTQFLPAGPRRAAATRLQRVTEGGPPPDPHLDGRNVRGGRQERRGAGRLQRLPAGRLRSGRGAGEMDARIRESIAGVHPRFPQARRHVHRAARATRRLLAAVSVYYSIDAPRATSCATRKAMNWIDNMGALAAMVKAQGVRAQDGRSAHRARLLGARRQTRRLHVVRIGIRSDQGM